MVGRCARWQLTLVIMAGASLSQPSMAAEWMVEPQVAMRSIFNDNIWVSRNRQNRTLDIRLEPQLKLLRESETSLMRVATGWSQKKYLSEDDETRGLFSLKGNGTKEFVRQKLSLEAAYIESATTSSDIDEITGVGANLVETIRTQAKLLPSWQYELTARALLEMNLNYEVVQFEESRQQWFDYSNLTPSISGMYQVHENLVSILAVGASQYELEDIEYEVQSYFTHGGLQWEINQNNQVDFLIGVQRVNTQLTVGVLDGKATLEEEQEQATLNANYQLEMEHGELKLELLRNIEPTSQGDVNFTDRGRLNYQINWQEDWETVFGLIAENRDNISESSRDVEQRTYIARARLRWQMTEHWQAMLDYRWLTRKYNTQNDWVDSHRVALSTIYSWDKKSLGITY